MNKLNSEPIVQSIRAATLFVVSGKDTVVNNSKTYEMYDQLGSPDKHLITYEDLDHAIW